LDIVKNFFQKRKENKRLEIAVKYGINFGDNQTGWASAYTINNLLVQEFNYLFEMILKRQ